MPEKSRALSRINGAAGFFGESLRRINQTDMSESLWKISQLPLVPWIIFLGEQADIIAQIEEALEQLASVLFPASEMEAIRQPE
jgi:UDP-N-acetyl-D-mannosaminuronic acid transferase (WecB/TagA/CpsF family)